MLHVDEGRAERKNNLRARRDAITVFYKPNWSLERSTVQLILQEIPLKNRETSNPEAFGIKARDERHPEKLQDSLEKEDLR